MRITKSRTPTSHWSLNYCCRTRGCLHRQYYSASPTARWNHLSHCSRNLELCSCCRPRCSAIPERCSMSLTHCSWNQSKCLIHPWPCSSHLAKHCYCPWPDWSCPSLYSSCPAACCCHRSPGSGFQGAHCCHLWLYSSCRSWCSNYRRPDLGCLELHCCFLRECCCYPSRSCCPLLRYWYCQLSNSGFLSDYSCCLRQCSDFLLSSSSHLSPDSYLLRVSFCFQQQSIRYQWSYSSFHSQRSICLIEHSDDLRLNFRLLRQSSSSLSQHSHSQWYCSHYLLLCSSYLSLCFHHQWLCWYHPQYHFCYLELHWLDP